MKKSQFIAGALAFLVPAASINAQTGAVPTNSTASNAEPKSFSITGGNVTADTGFYFFNGLGILGNTVDILDGQTDDVYYILSNLFEIDPNFKPVTPTKASGTLYGFSLGYALETRALGSITIEASYREGTMDDDSGVHPYESSAVVDDENSIISLSGDFSRRISVDSKEAGILALWRPKNRIGDYLAAGLEYAHGNYECEYGIDFSLLMKVNDEIAESETERVLYNYTLETNDVLLHVRLGDKPIATFNSGKVSIVARANLAAGYSMRDCNEATIRTITKEDDNLRSTDSYDASDTWIAKGDASLLLFYKTDIGTFNIGGGFAFESDLGGNRSGERKGLMAKLGYSRAW